MKQARGFTLIELAIVLVIVTILIGGLAMPLSAQIQARRIAETNKTLEEAREAIIGYAMSNTASSSSCTCTYTVMGTDPCLFELSAATPPACSSLCPAAIVAPPSCPATDNLTLTLPIDRPYLPCPDTDNDGKEDREGSGACTAPAGLFPWVTLGTARQDAWGNRIRYAVAADFADSTQGFHRGSASGGEWNQVLSSTSKCNPLDVDIAADVPVVVLSHGPNSRGARNVNIPKDSATPTPPPETGTNELQNLGSLQDDCTARSFIGSNPSEAFDDLLTWVSFPQLISRVCPAGGCP